MIVIRHRAPKQRWNSVEFAAEAEASDYVKGLPATQETVLSGAAEPIDQKTPRAMWTGTVAFGMVSAPIKLYAATEDGRPSLRQLCREHGSPMSYKRWCGAHGHEIPDGGTAKGVELAGSCVPLTDAELDELPSPTAKVVQVAEFVPEDAVPPRFHDSVYFVGPDKLGRHAYDLLVAAMVATRTVAIAKVTMRDRERLAVIRPEGGRLVLYTLHWQAEVRSNERLANLQGSGPVDVAELRLATALIEGMRTASFEPAKYTDTYAAALVAMVANKAETIEPTTPAPAGAKVLDLFATLKASVDAAKAKRAS